MNRGKKMNNLVIWGILITAIGTVIGAIMIYFGNDKDIQEIKDKNEKIIELQNKAIELSGNLKRLSENISNQNLEIKKLAKGIEDIETGGTSFPKLTLENIGQYIFLRFTNEGINNLRNIEIRCVKAFVPHQDDLWLEAYRCDLNLPQKKEYRDRLTEKMIDNYFYRKSVKNFKTNQNIDGAFFLGEEFLIDTRSENKTFIKGWINFGLRFFISSDQQDWVVLVMIHRINLTGSSYAQKTFKMQNNGLKEIFEFKEDLFPVEIYNQTWINE